jgi:hypothetical protein
LLISGLPASDRDGCPETSSCDGGDINIGGIDVGDMDVCDIDICDIACPARGLDPAGEKGPTAAGRSAATGDPGSPGS